MKFNKEMLLLYAVTDRGENDSGKLYEQIEEALQGGVTLVQLREKTLDTDAFIEEAIRVKALCRHYGVPLIINDNIDVAIACGADGVHVGRGDAPASEIRKKVGKDFIIGVTAKTVQQAKEAEAAGADYLGVGAVFPSPTKKDAIRITAQQLKEICASVSIPVVAIGGIGLSNLPQLAGGGMAGVAVVSALFSAENIKEAAGALKEASRKTVAEEGNGI